MYSPGDGARMSEIAHGKLRLVASTSKLFVHKRGTTPTAVKAAGPRRTRPLKELPGIIQFAAETSTWSMPAMSLRLAPLLVLALQSRKLHVVAS
jgi:hypothetical protein